MIVVDEYLAIRSLTGLLPADLPDEPIAVTTAWAYKVKGWQQVDLTWTGATGPVDILRNGAVVIAGTANDGAETDAIGAKGRGSYSYRLCQTGTSTCSNTVTVGF